MEEQNSKWKQFCDIYQKLLRNGCLCHVEFSLNQLTKELTEIFSYEDQHIKISGANHQGKKSLEVKLLCTGIVWLIGKNYTNVGLSSTTICRETVTISKYLQTDLFFDNLVFCMCTEENKFLCRGVQKALAIFMYLLPLSEFSVKFRKLLNIINAEDFDSSKIRILSLIRALLYFNCNTGHILKPSETLPEEIEIFSCKMKNPCQPVDVKKLKYCCCQETCQEWSHFIEKFIKKEIIENKQELAAEFLELWKSLTNVIIQSKSEELYNIVKKENIIQLLLLLNYVPSIALNIALEIIIQSLYVIPQLEMTCKDQGDKNQVEEAVANALNSELLENLMIPNASHGFGGALLPRHGSKNRYSRYKSEISVQYNRSLKQVVLMALKALAGVHNMKSMLTAYFKTEIFVKEKMSLLSDVPAYSWILELFLDQDDLLLDAMLASLNIYLNLVNYIGDAATVETSHLKESLNPHKMFIVFLSELGRDHHVLLEFLMSSETCILLYLMHYSKLILCEWENFIKAHSVLHYKRIAACQTVKRTSSRNQMLNVLKVKHVYEEVGNICDLQTAKETEANIMPCSNYNTGFQSVSNNLLVSYSSSSKSDQEFDLEDAGTSESDTGNQNPDVYCTIQVFKRLRQTIERLLDQKEFPYNAQPLIHLLKECEIKYMTEF